MIRRTHLFDSSVIAVTFSQPVTSPHAPISLVGNFNEWHPFANPLVKRPDGTATTTIHVPIGYHIIFRYLGSDGVWFDDQDAEWVDYEGGHLSV